jgi:prepilin-type N-terminal cleavage/methylation domain-containing protein
MRTCRSRGFTIAEITCTLSLLAIFSLVAGRVFFGVTTMVRQTEAAESRISAYESATAQLRRDAWSASRIEVPDAAHARLTGPGGKTITWAIGPAGAMVRSDGAGRPGTWSGAAPNLRFEAAPASLGLADLGADAAAAQFPSQVILGGGGR